MLRLSLRYPYSPFRRDVVLPSLQGLFSNFSFAAVCRETDEHNIITAAPITNNWCDVGGWRNGPQARRQPREHVLDIPPEARHGDLCARGDLCALDVRTLEQRLRTIAETDSKPGSGACGTTFRKKLYSHAGLLISILGFLAALCLLLFFVQ